MQPVLSRHRLPPNYRYPLTVLWLTPLAIFVVAIVYGRGLDAGLLDPRFWLPALLMTLPAVYTWQEGIDVLPDGMRVRVHVPRYYPYEHLDTWYYDARPQRRLVTVWNARSRKVVECYAGHLTDLPVLLRSLKAHVRYRNWPC